MQRRMKVVIAGGAAAAAIVGGASWAVAGGADDGADGPITGESLDRASAAALEHTGGGKVTDTETGDEESSYEVEVTLDDGTEVDVQLDEAFNVVGDETDDDDGTEDEADD